MTKTQHRGHYTRGRREAIRPSSFPLLNPHTLTGHQPPHWRSPCWMRRQQSRRLFFLARLLGSSVVRSSARVRSAALCRVPLAPAGTPPRNSLPGFGADTDTAEPRSLCGSLPCLAAPSPAFTLLSAAHAPRAPRCPRPRWMHGAKPAPDPPTPSPVPHCASTAPRQLRASALYHRRLFGLYSPIGL